MGPDAKEAVPALTVALNDEVSYIGKAAAEALKKITPQPAQAKD